MHKSRHPSWAPYRVSLCRPPVAMCLNECLLGELRVWMSSSVQIPEYRSCLCSFRARFSGRQQPLCTSAPPVLRLRELIHVQCSAQRPAPGNGREHKLGTTPGPTKAFVSLLGKQAPSWPGLGLLGQEGRASTWVLGSGPQKSLAGLAWSGYWC